MEKELKDIRWDFRWFAAMLFAILSMIGYDLVKSEPTKMILLIYSIIFPVLALLAAIIAILD